MRSLKANPDIIVVNTASGASSGSTTIQYEKQDRPDELWERMPGSGWSLINVHVRTGQGDIADRTGQFPITLKPGQSYDIGIYEQDHGPLSSDPINLLRLKVYCILKRSNVTLITDENRNTGGTWHWHQIATNVPTSIVTIGVSQKASFLDSDGIPRLKDMEGAPTAALGTTTNHLVEINPLLPGNHYFFLVVVTDAAGNWDSRREEFSTLRRKMTVEFPTIHIYNDGDPGSVGEGEFWFRVLEGQQVLQEFHLPTQDIDDWGETDRSYSVGFAHIGIPTVVTPGTQNVKVFSTGIEHDGIFESDEGAGLVTVNLPLPVGRFIEKVNNNKFIMDCPPSTVDDDFHYGVEVRWSVDYLP